MKIKKLAATLTAALGLSVVAVGNAQSVELRVGDSLPPDHIIARHLTQPWIEKVQQASKGEVKIKHYPAEQAGKAKDMLSLTQSGVLDIGYVGPAYVSDKMPLSGVGELPGLFTTSCQVTKAYWSLAKEGGYFYEKEFKPNKIRPLFIAALPPYQLAVSNNKALNDLSDFAGLKIRAAGGAQELSLSKLNAVAVKMAPPDIYESMSRKTIDGTLLPFISLDSYKLSPLIKASTHGANFGTVIVTYSISDRAWNRLSKETQELLTQVGDEVTQNACEQFDREEQEVMAQLEADGVQLIEFNEADQERLTTIIQEVSQNWADRLDARNRPGSEALNEFNNALSQVD